MTTRQHTRRCTCGHGYLTHHWRTDARDNGGVCLAYGCGCVGESAQNALGMGGLSVAERYPRDIKREPDRANESDSLASVSTRPKGA